MRVILIKKDAIYKTNLPSFIMGDYWINNEENKRIINIEGKKGKWYVTSSNNVKIINYQNSKDKESIVEISSLNENVLKEVILEEYSMYHVVLSDQKEVYILYCEPMNQEFIKLDIKSSSEILIGKDVDNSISFNSPIVKEKHSKIFFSNGKLLLENFDNEYGTFINDYPVSSKFKLLFNGDVIFVMGLRIIIMGRSIYINNPLGLVQFNKKIFEINNDEIEQVDIKEEQESDIEIYSEKDYFARAPKITNIIEREKVKIDAPPQIQSKEGMPFIYVLGSTLSMGAVTLISSFSTIEKLINGTMSFKEAFPSLLITFMLLISTILIPILNIRYDKKQKINYEKTRQKRYKEYINSKINHINEIMNKQRDILYENYITAEECNNIILTRNSRLWERKIENPDFLTIRLGIGDLPLDIDIQYPEEQFAMQDDNLREMLSEIGDTSKTLKNAPITVSLAKRNISALLVEDKDKLVEKFLQNAILQLITFHSYEDLKLVFLVKNENKSLWEHIKLLPHVWDNEKQIRFFADEYNDMKEISKYLEEELENRSYNDQNLDYRSFMPYYLIITDDYKKIERLRIITEILKMNNNVGFSIFCITDNMMQLPNECKTFIKLEDNGGIMFESEISSTNQRPFIFDSSYTFFFEKISREISNIPIKYTSSSKLSLPNNYTFLEMYDVGRIEQLNILERWRNNDSTISLQAPIGIDAEGIPVSLDIHERYHGPHGLIAGSTGSGKSELIITYILSLAINYHPDDVNFILIDYKGGGLAGAFQKRDIKLPHLVGTITNIDTVGLQRSLASIQSELRRRQVMFNEARNRTDEGTIDIYKYQKLYHEGIVDKPIPHLLIICDEFAELKQQQEEFMDELISVARIGRSLGVHLILATQKPAGIVNEQIRSNSKFAICLKVQSREDSNDVINRPDAVELKKTGQFFMQVGNDEYFTLGLGAWSGAPYIPTEENKKKIDNSIEFISNTGRIFKKIGISKKENLNSCGEQLTNIVKYTYELAKKENIKTSNLWIDSIPETIFLGDIRKKYNVKNTKNIINPVVGEFDDPNNQRQGVVRINLSNEGNTVIYGNANSGKETLLSTMIYDIIDNYKTEEVQLYLFDFGSEALKIFKTSPHVGDIVFINDNEKVSRFFEMIQKEIRNRIEILSDYGGDYNLYIKSEDNIMPMIVVIINNYEAFSEIYDKYDDVFLTLTREGSKCGVVFIITANSSNNIRYRLSQNLKQKITLQLNSEDEYLNIWDDVGKKRPSKIFGRGLIKLEDIYEFQVAKICESEKWNKNIKDKIEEAKQNNKLVSKSIPVLPEIVMPQDVKDYVTSIKSVPLGINSANIEVFTHDFSKNLINIITSKNIDDAADYALHVLDQIKQVKDTIVVVFDIERTTQNGKIKLLNDYQNFILGIQNNLNKNKNVICAIIGIDKFTSDIDSNIIETIEKAEELENYRFIIVEGVNKLKSHEYDDWYRNYITGDNGIWVGNGVDEQYLINIDSNRQDNKKFTGRSFGSVITNGKQTVIKLLGMKDER